jgi:thiamine biosynthesis lipoprotein
MADALSTAIFNMSYEKGIRLIESQDETEALWVFQVLNPCYVTKFY